METLELKKYCNKYKISLDGFNSKMEMIEEIVSERDGTLIEIIQCKTQRKKELPK